MKLHNSLIFILTLLSGCAYNSDNKDLERAKAAYYDPDACTNHKYDDIYKDVMAEILTGKPGFDGPNDYYKTISPNINIISERKAVSEDVVNNPNKMPPSCRIDYNYKNNRADYAVIYLKEDGDLDVYLAMDKDQYIRDINRLNYQKKISQDPDVLFCERTSPQYRPLNYSYETSGLSGFTARNNMMRENSNIVGMCIDQRRKSRNLPHSPYFPYGIN